MNAQIDMIDLNQWAEQTHEYRATLSNSQRMSLKPQSGIWSRS